MDPLEIFAAWVAGREADDPEGFATLVRSHPAHAAELEELHATWRRLAAASEASVVGASTDDEPGGSDPIPTTGKLGRYDVEGEIARGGMGAILRVWDGNLRRNLAMKVILDREAPPETEAPSPGRAKELARFLEEARVTGQLDHPGIVPVHELGLETSRTGRRTSTSSRRPTPPST
jgi:hypothetical protein